MTDHGHGSMWEPIKANLHDPHAAVRWSPNRRRGYDITGNLVGYDRIRDLWFVKTPVAILNYRCEKRRELAR